MRNNDLDKDTWILLHDGWYPGLESLEYIRACGHYKFKIAMCLHAGTWDENDFLSYKLGNDWGAGIEETWFRIADAIFVATDYHKNLILNKRCVSSDKIYNTGFPIKPKYHFNEILQDRVPVDLKCVFPHRLAFEKQYRAFDWISAHFNDFNDDSDSQAMCFVKTKEVAKTKDEYYRILHEASFSISCALQETWGIAMIESVFAGCVPIVPNTVAYKELYPAMFKYEVDEHANTLEYAKAALNHLRKLTTGKIKIYHQYTELLELKEKFETMGTRAIPNMLNVMRTLNES